MNGLDLFSGIGGITKALEGYVRPIAYCENDRYAQAVLLSRMQSGELPLAPIWTDVKTLAAKLLLTMPDIVYGGFPCQDISVAGRGAGLEGKRSGLFFEIARLIGEIRPAFVFLENVPAIHLRGGNIVVGTLADLGYDCRWDVLSAADVGAVHRRDRWWLLAHARHRSGRDVGPTEIGQDAQKERGGDHHASRGSGEQPENVADSQGGTMRDDCTDYRKTDREKYTPIDAGISCGKEAVADASSAISPGLPIGAKEKYAKPRKPSNLEDSQRDGWEEQRDSGVLGRKAGPIADAGWWLTEPNVGRVANGVPQRVDRLRALGNSVVPAQAREAFERLMGL